MFRQNNTELFNEKYQDKYIHTTNYLEKCLWHRFNLRLAPNWQSSFSLLPNQRLMNMRNDSTSSNGGLDQSIQLFISTDGQLKIEKLIKIIIVMFFSKPADVLEWSSSPSDLWRHFLPTPEPQQWDIREWQNCRLRQWLPL